MSNVVNKNMIVPEVYAALVQEKIEGKMHVGSMCNVLGDLMGKPGETLTFPAMKYIGDAVDHVVGEAMTADQLETTTTTATIKMVAAKGINIYDYDNQVEMDNNIEKAASNQATAIARKIDTDAITEALKSPLKLAIATKNVVTQAEMLKALGVYGDDRNVEDFSNAGIVMHSAFAESLYAMDLFVSAATTTAQAENGIVRQDCIGTFLGIKVYLSDRCYDVTTQEPFILIIKNDSLAIIPKETPFAEVARDASRRLNTIYCSDTYALALVDDSGVVIVKKTVPTQE